MPLHPRHRGSAPWSPSSSSLPPDPPYLLLSLTNILLHKIRAAYLPRARYRTGLGLTPDLDFRENPYYRSKLDGKGPGLIAEGYPGPDLLMMSSTHRWNQPEG